MNVQGMGAGLFTVADFSPGQVVCRERPLLCYDLLPERDELAARVSAFLAPHRSVSEGGHYEIICSLRRFVTFFMRERAVRGALAARGQL